MLRAVRLTLIACFAALAPLTATVLPVRAASVTFGDPSAVSTFGKRIEFRQPYSGGGFREADLVILYPDAIGPFVVKLQTTTAELRYELDTSTGQLQPNTNISAHFEVVFADGSVQAGPELSVTYADTRFSWRTKSGSVVQVHWYTGSDSFAGQCLQLAEKGIAKAASFMGYSETKTIDFFVYSDQNALYGALGPGTRDNVGGLANPATRTLFGLIAPGDMSYAQTVIPHELTHIVFNDVTSNPYHFPPHWLDEGIAVYVSEGYGSYDRSLVKKAAGSQTLMPLAAIRGQFPTSQQRFYLAYSESVSAVDYFMRTYGQAALNKMLAAFGRGASDDEAFIAGTGSGIAAFDAAWQAAQGVKALASYGPQPAPTGALPPDWTGSGMTAGSPAPGTSASGSPGTTPSPGSNGGLGGYQILVAVTLVATLAVVVVVGAAFLRQRPKLPPPMPPPAAPSPPASPET